MKALMMAAGAALTLAASPVVAADQGVTDTEVVFGGLQDLSGPFAAFSVPAVKAAQHYFDEVNAAGGVHGRKIKYVVEDHGYNVSKVGPAANKLINRDKVFAMLLSTGTPINLAAFKIQDPKGIPNFAPLSAARQMLNEPVHLHFQNLSFYYDDQFKATAYMVKEHGVKTACSMYLPNDFGKDVSDGTKDGAKAAGIAFGAETTHKPDETDFVGSLSKLKAANCDLVSVALGVRQVLTVLGTAKKLGLDMKFIGSTAAFHTVVAKAGEGKIADGFYAAAGWKDIEARMDNPAVGKWVKEFTEVAGKKMLSTGAMLGRSAAEMLVRGLEKAGKDLSRESLIAAMETLEYHDDILDVKIKLSKDNHQASSTTFISQVKGATWNLLEELD